MEDTNYYKYRFLILKDINDVDVHFLVTCTPSSLCKNKISIHQLDLPNTLLDSYDTEGLPTYLIDKVCNGLMKTSILLNYNTTPNEVIKRKDEVLETIKRPTAILFEPGGRNILTMSKGSAYATHICATKERYDSLMDSYTKKGYVLSLDSPRFIFEEAKINKPILLPSYSKEPWNENISDINSIYDYDSLSDFYRNIY